MAVVNKTLQDLKCYDKPVITIFNKMDLYVKNTFDEWLDEDTKMQLLEELKQRWINVTQGNCIFISATEKQNIDELRKVLTDKIRELYRIRYPYKTEFLY
jgi:GTP-binding protein HflX